MGGLQHELPRNRGSVRHVAEQDLTGAPAASSDLDIYVSPSCFRHLHIGVEPFIGAAYLVLHRTGPFWLRGTAAVS